MITKIQSALGKLGVCNGSSIAVAFSGGADSTALLHLLCKLAEVNEFKLSAIHINHQLRGAESDADETFAKQFCEQHGITLLAYSVDVAKESELSGESTELCARRLRYEIFDRMINEGWIVATAHTASDNAETVLFNLARGTGVSGLAGIPSKREGYIRPLIDCTREMVEEYCALNELKYVTDSTNLTDDYTRNFIRHNIVPRLKDINSSFEFSVRETSNQLRAVDDMLNKMAVDLLKQGKCADGYSCETLLSTYKPVLARAVRIAAFDAIGKYPDSLKTNQLCEIVADGGKIQLYNGWFASAGKILQFYQSANKCNEELQISNGDVEFGDFVLNFETKTLSVNNLLINNAIDCDKIVGKAIIRCRKAGDTIKIKGRPNKQLRKLMNEKHIPDEQRDAYPVVSDDLGLIYAYGCGIAQRVLPDENTKNVIIINGRGKNNA